jgi:hypothetical protein
MSDDVHPTHISHKERARYPEFPVRYLGRDRVCAFPRRKAHEDWGTHETSQEIGDMGHPSVLSRRLVCTSDWAWAYLGNVGRPEMSSG